MNKFLKAVIKEIADLVATGEAAIGKLGIAAIIPLLIKDGMDLPDVVANFADLKPELEALLKDPAADADLLAYVAAMFTGSGKAEAIISASAALVIELVVKGEALVQAIQAPAPAAPAA